VAQAVEQGDAGSMLVVEQSGHLSHEAHGKGPMESCNTRIVVPE
jgi:hypothetical protein